MFRQLARFAPVLAALSLLTFPALGAGRAYRVRAFETQTTDGTGDRSPGSDGVFWLPDSTYDNASGGHVPKVSRLRTDGTLTSWTLDTAPLSFYPTAVRLGASGTVWVLAPRTTEGQAVLYALDPTGGAVRRYSLPFTATDMAIDPATGTPWVAGTGKLASLSGTALMTFTIANFAGSISGLDGSHRLWLESDNGSLRSFDITQNRLDVYADAGGGMVQPRVDPVGDVWSVQDGGSQLLRFRPSTRALTRFPLVSSAANWGGIAAGPDGQIVLCASYGPHVLSHSVSDMPDGTTATLAAAVSTTLTGASSVVDEVDSTVTATTPAPVGIVDRVVYAEGNAGRQLFRTSAISYTTMLWSGEGELLTGSGPVQWWQPLEVGDAFTTQAVLPVALSVRPDSPTDNFLTEVTVANIDASPAIDLVFTTATAQYTVPLTLAPGSTQVLPNVIQSLKQMGASSLPDSAVGTLSARFRNGRGVMAARVYTLFGNGGAFPAGSTTGLGFSSLDPSEEIFVQQTALNGLKNTPDFRTNLAVANLCAAQGACPTLNLTAQFFDDSTGASVGQSTITVPPNQFVQLNAPLAGFAGATGETFSVVLTANGDSAGYDAYATVVSNINQDAAFIRASSAINSYTQTLPVVVDQQGAGTRFSSECAITNVDNVPVTADMTFTSARTGNQVTQALSLDRGHGVRYPNAVDHFRQIDPTKVGADDYGSIRIAFRNFGRGFASARTFATNGTGLAYTAIDPFLTRAASRKRIVGLKETTAYRTNLAVVHLGATTADPNASITVRVTVTDPTGKPVGNPFVQQLGPGQLVQWNRILADPAVGASGEGYVATIERIAGVDGFDAYVTVIDNVSTDSTFLRAE